MSFANPHFAEPQWLWLAIFGPVVLLVLQRYAAWARRRQLASMASPHFVEELTRNHSPARRGVKNVLLLMAVAAFGIALARPQWGEQEDTSQALGHDVVFILDCSASMLATDVTPSRLQRARLAIMDFVQQHGRGRVGLVTFAGQAFLQCPLTYDHGAFEEALNAANEKTIPVPGTDIGRALDEAIRSMEETDRRKLMVLVTDGEDLEKGGAKMALELSKQGAVIYTIGVGTPAGAEITSLNPQGQVEVLKDKNGEVVRSRLDEPTLRAIAQASGGEYYPMGPLGEGFAKVRLALEGTSGREGSAPRRKFGVDRFHYPLAVLLLLLVAEPLIGTRRKA